MSSGSLELVHRLYRRMVEAARERRDGGLDELTIGDVYQHLVPYRGVRSELGVFELAEYENALLRLLAGEGDYLRVADERARAELASELASPNPILGIYRDYSSLRVELLRPEDHSLAGMPRQAGEPDSGRSGDTSAEPIPEVTEFVAEEAGPEEPGPELAYGEEDAPKRGDDSPEPLPELRYPAPAPVPADATRVAPAIPTFPADPSSPGERSAGCIACGLPLPEVEGLRFCPHCGTDQTAVPCERCGAPIRDEWNFCIRCGARRPAE